MLIPIERVVCINESRIIKQTQGLCHSISEKDAVMRQQNTESLIVDKKKKPHQKTQFKRMIISYVIELPQYGFIQF